MFYKTLKIRHTYAHTPTDAALFIAASESILPVSQIPIPPPSHRIEKDLLTESNEHVHRKRRHSVLKSIVINL